MTINERIKTVREKLGLSQARFAAGIPVSNGYIAAIELGNREPTERIIRLICVQYKVNEAWLRDEKGEIFLSEADARLDHVVKVFQGLEPDFQDYVLEQIDRLMKLQQKQEGEKKDESGT